MTPRAEWSLKRPVLLLFALAFAPTTHASPPASSQSASPFASQLALECDALLRFAIQRPYGIGWSQDATADLAPKPTPRTIPMTPLNTPAAGLLLLWAGDELHDSSYRKAAEQVARGIAICQKTTGRVPDRPIFSRAPIVNEERAVVADRSSTRCALGLLLALLDDSAATQSNTPSTGDDPVHRSAARCSDWLGRQLTPSSFWPTAFPPGAPIAAAVRIVRFDDGDYRDSTIALLLSAQILGSEPLQRIASKPIAAIQKVTLKADAHGPNLWNTAVTVDGTGTPDKFLRGPDVQASRFNLQTLLAGFLLTDDQADLKAFNDAVKSLRQSTRPDGNYNRYLDPTAQADFERSNSQPPTTQSIFGTPATQPAQHEVVRGPFGVPPLLNASDQLTELGRYKYLASIASPFTIHQQLEATLCGLMDDPLTSSLPATAAEIPAWLTANADRFKALDGPPPQDLQGKVKKIWLLLIRAKLERIAAET